MRTVGSHQVSTPDPLPASEYRTALADRLPSDALMDRVTTELANLVPSADGVLVGLVEESGVIRLVHASGALHGLVGASVDPARSLSGLCMKAGFVLRCDDAATDPRVDRVILDQIEMASLVVVPLVRNGETFGVASVVAAATNAFSDHDVTTCQAVAEILAGIISSGADIARLVGFLGPDQVSVPEAAGGDGAYSDSIARFASRVLSPATTLQVEVRHRIHNVLALHQFAMVFQPIVTLRDLRLAGVEALARFPGPPAQTPDRWFADATTVGLGVELEVAAIDDALGALRHLPDGVTLALNAGPDALASSELRSAIARHDASRVVIELTEHAPVMDYTVIRAAVGTLRRLGARLSVDDTGAGFASLTHIVHLAPELIKLDRWIVAGVDADPVRRALVTALVGFAHELGAEVIGEGIETQGELDALRQLGVDYGEGYLLARPGPLATVVSAVGALGG